MRQRHSSSKKHFSPRKKPPQGRGSSSALIEGRLDLKGKVGFIITDEPGKTDVLVQGASLKIAMNGDRVLVRVRGTQADGRRIGEIAKVVEHAKSTIVGLFKRFRNLPFLVTEDGELTIRLPELRGLKPNEGDVIVARITEWPTEQKEAAGMLEKVLGTRDASGVDLQILLSKYELPNIFPADVEKEAATFGDVVPESALKDRETLFHKTIFTIDGADAKDFDDAVSLEPRPQGGWILGVHIADVSHYVREGSKLDKEAFHRSTSVYLSGSVIPMLPFALSDNLCSLRPDVIRLTLSCEMEIDPTGLVVEKRVFESAIKSSKRFTYDEIERVLNGEAPAGLDPKVIADVREMGTVAKRLRKKRFERGSLDFDFPEPYTILDPHGRPIDIKRRERLEAHRLIEDFMLLANENVAQFMSKGPFIYRVHEKPDLTKLKALKTTLQAVGIPVSHKFETGNPKELQAAVSASQGKPAQAMVQMMILRSLKQAIYSPENKGHYGIASACYTHFTSPIRRYPDLIVHRLLREKLQHKFTAERQKHWDAEMPDIAANSSKRERVAVDAEREFLDVQRVRLMQDRIGQTFEGVVSGVTRFGIFVVLNNPFVEGLIHVTNLTDDYYFFDEVRVTMRGKRTGRVFRMGSPVTVLLAAANVAKRQLDFELVKGGK